MSFLRFGILPAITLKWLEKRIIKASIVAERDVIDREAGGFNLFESDEEPDYFMSSNNQKENESDDDSSTKDDIHLVQNDQFMQNDDMMEDLELTITER